MTIEPLTPADCDLRDFGFMPLDASRLLDSDLFALSTGEEFKAAIALWCKAWQQIPAGSLPEDDRVLAHLSGAGSRWKKLKDMALRGFIRCSDGRLYHPVVAEKANEAWAKKLSYRERSRKGNKARWESSKDAQKQSKSDPSGIAEAVLEPPKGQGQGQGEGSVTNVTAQIPKIDPERIMFDHGIATLTGAGKTESAARSILGKWKRDHGAADVIAALGAAQREGAIDPVGFIEGRWRRAKADSDDGFSIGGVRMSSPC